MRHLKKLVMTRKLKQSHVDMNIRLSIALTDRRSCFNSLDCSLEDFSRQSKVSGAAVHDALIIVVL